MTPMSLSTSPPASSDLLKVAKKLPPLPKKIGTKTFSRVRRKAPRRLSKAQNPPRGGPKPYHSPTPASSRYGGISERGSTWAWEIAALVLSISSLVTLLVLLICVNGLPLAQWNFVISLNALISILAATSRTSLGFTISSCLAQNKWNWFRRKPDTLIGFGRFDEASRGPWGSLWLIVWLRVSHWVVIGAFVTIALIAFEPFLQAVVFFDGRLEERVSHHTATTPKVCYSPSIDSGSYVQDEKASTNRLDSGVSSGNVALRSYVSQPDSDMAFAFRNGFSPIYSASMLPVPFNCPTANCTWTPFETVAVCSECKNVIKHLTRREEFVVFNYRGNSVGRTATVYSLPYINLTNPSDSLGSDIQTAYMAATRISNHDLTLSFSGYSTMITTVQVINVQATFATSADTWDHAPFIATECALYFCVKMIESVVQNGRLEEETLTYGSDRVEGSYSSKYGTNISLEAYEKRNNYSLYSYPLDFDRNDLVLWSNRDFVGLAQRIARYNLTQRTVGSMVNFVNNDLLSTSMVWGPGYDISSPRGAANALHENLNHTQTFDNVASAVSDWMRRSCGFKAHGTANDWILQIRVIWSYTSLPLSTIILGFMFSVWSMLETRALKLEPWKTDIIAILTHSVDVETGHRLKRADRKGKLGETVRSMKVRLENTRRRLELRIKQG